MVQLQEKEIIQKIVTAVKYSIVAEHRNIGFDGAYLGSTPKPFTIEVNHKKYEQVKVKEGDFY